jgi:hypothetical protein
MCVNEPIFSELSVYNYQHAKRTNANANSPVAVWASLCYCNSIHFTANGSGICCISLHII